MNLNNNKPTYDFDFPKGFNTAILFFLFWDISGKLTDLVIPSTYDSHADVIESHFPNWFWVAIQTGGCGKLCLLLS